MPSHESDRLVASRLPRTLGCSTSWSAHSSRVRISGNVNYLFR